MDWANQYASAVVGGVPLVVVVMGLVQLAKTTLPINGAAVRVLSAVIGLVCGSAYQLSVVWPVDAAQWVAVVAYGVGLGLVASGVYSTGTAMADRVASHLGEITRRP